MTYNTKYTGNEKWLNKISLALGTCMCDMYKFIKKCNKQKIMQTTLSCTHSVKLEKKNTSYNKKYIKYNYFCILT